MVNPMWSGYSKCVIGGGHLMEIVGVLIGMAMLLFVGLVALFLGLGWLVPAGMGIRRLRRGDGGAGLLAGGALWAVIAVFAGFVIIRGAGALFSGYMPTAFDPAEYHGETGEVHLTWDGPCELTIFSSEENERWLLSGEDGRVVGPAGEYAISSWTLKAAGDDGRTWQARGYGWGQPELSRVRIAADHPARLSVGPPFRARLDVDTTGDRVSIGLGITGGEGASYTIEPEGRRRAPSFEVLNASGDVVWSEDFEFG